MSGTILLVEDQSSQRLIISALLENLGYEVEEAKNGKEALSFLKEEKRSYINLILLDMIMPEMDGLETLEIVKERYPGLPVIMLTGCTNIKDAVKAMKLGALDFLTKPPDLEHLGISIKNALKISTLTKEVSRLKRKEDGTTAFDDLIGHDKGLANAVNIGRKAASSNIPVLISGETGVGKELFAQAIHGESERVGRNFVAVNCGAIPDQLVESTLFGHEKGAFTGAIAKTPGKFREADGGTIFLDEIGELPLEAQVKLLRVLQQKEIEPVGASKIVPVNVRIISATNKNLSDEVKAGNFREDLFFRLNVLPIIVPPLRERQADIISLVHHFIERFAASENVQLKDITKNAEAMLLARKWSGNVRELENLIHRVIVLSENDFLDIDDFNIFSESLDPQSNIISFPDDSSHGISVIRADGQLKTIYEIEQEAIQIALDHHNNNVTAAARSLGMAKSTFYKKMEKINSA